jgi:pimeloyl-ACP methyl ester carboxylesterase
MHRLLPASALLVLTACGSLAAASAGPDHPRAYRDWQSSYVTANGLRLHYWRTGGAGKPVLIMAHGITDYGLNYAHLAEKFAADFDIILYDACGHGYSDKPDGPYTLAAHAADLVGLIQALGLEHPILMGHSMGGSTISLAVAQQPGLARAVVLEDPANMIDPEQGLTEKVIPNWRAQIENNQKIPVAELIKNARTQYHPGWSDAAYELWAESKRLVSPRVVEILHGDGFGNAAAVFPKITVPTLILKADANAKLRKRHQQIAQLLLHGKLVHIAGAGHVIRNDRPADVEKQLREFLAGLK